MATTVTVDRARSETLLQRAECHNMREPLALQHPLHTISVPKPEYDGLLRLAAEYRALKEALYRGGLDDSTLKVLIDGNPGSMAPAGEAPKSSSPEAAAGFGGAGCGGLFPEMTQSPPFSRTLLASDAEKQQPLGRSDRRTIIFANVPERATHKDLIAVIQGGQLLDLYLRPQERSASISFADGAAAQEFLTYAKRNDIYILGKRVDVRWSERQFILPNHVARKLAGGASRNLVLHNVPPRVSEEGLREDMEHIHNLVVVDVIFKNLNVYLSLNSVHNALFARTCMMSRSTYKGIKIDFAEDECAVPLPTIQRFPAKKENARPPPKKAMPLVNRFHLLDIEESEDGFEEDEEEDDDEPELDRFVGRSHFLDMMPTRITA